MNAIADMRKSYERAELDENNPVVKPSLDHEALHQ